MPSWRHENPKVNSRSTGCKCGSHFFQISRFLNGIYQGISLFLHCLWIMELIGTILCTHGVSRRRFVWGNSTCSSIDHQSSLLFCRLVWRIYRDSFEMEADSSECNIKVVCRFRPQSQSEINSGGLVMSKYPSQSNDTTVFGVGNTISQFLDDNFFCHDQWFTILFLNTFLLFAESCVYFRSCI